MRSFMSAVKTENSCKPKDGQLSVIQYGEIKYLAHLNQLS